MKRKAFNKNNKRPFNRYDWGGTLELGAQKLGLSNPYVGMALGFDAIAQGGSNLAAETFGGEAYKDNPDFINEGIYGDRSGMNITRMWTSNKSLNNTIDKIEDYGNEGFKAGTLEGLVLEYQNTDFLKKSNIGSGALAASDFVDYLFDPISYTLSSLFGKRKSATQRQNEINNAIEEANRRKMADFSNRIQQAQNKQKFSDMQNMFGFGGFFDSPYIGGAIDYDFTAKDLDIKRMNALAKNKINALPSSSSSDEVNIFAGGGKIYIKPSKRGTFTAAAKKRGMGVLEFASKVLANKENYSPAMVKKANFARNAAKWHAFGGDLNSNGSIFDLGYTNVGNGGNHENNIYGGVPVGVDSEGIPNLVELGEVIWGDYVFSDRLKNPKTGRTFAKDAKRAQKESEERPNDPISRKGREAKFAKLAQELEDARQKEAAKKQTKNYFAGGGSKDDEETIDKGLLFDNDELVITGDALNRPQLAGWNPNDPFGVGKLEFKLSPTFEKPYDVDWNTYEPSKGWDVMEGMAMIPGIYNLINPPKAYSYKVPKSREISYNPLGDMLVYTPFDTDYRTSQLLANAAATRRALKNSGNPMSNAAILASDYNTQLNLGALAREAAEYNLAQRQATAQFNRGTRQANMEAALRAAIANQAKDMQEAGLEIEAQKYYQDQLDKLYAAKLGALENIAGNVARTAKDRRNRYDALWSAKYLPGGQTIKTT